MVVDTSPVTAPYAPLTCAFCGSSPAIKATVRGHQGIVIVMRFLKLGGPYCRSCGIATVREMSARSLWQGWTSFFSIVINPLTLLWNLVIRLRLQRLPAVQSYGHAHPMDEGKPLYQRLGTLGLIIPVAFFGWLLYNKFVLHEADATGASAGECVSTSGDRLSVVVPCGDAKAEFRVAGRLEGTRNAMECTTAYPSVTKTFTETRRSTDYVLCLEPVTAR